MRDAELNLESQIRKYLYLQCSVVLFCSTQSTPWFCVAVCRLYWLKDGLGKIEGFDVFSKQIAVLKDLQFLLACCKQLCLKKNKHPKLDGRVGKP